MSDAVVRVGDVDCSVLCTAQDTVTLASYTCTVAIIHVSRQPRLLTFKCPVLFGPDGKTVEAAAADSTMSLCRVEPVVDTAAVLCHTPVVDGEFAANAVLRVAVHRSGAKRPHCVGEFVVTSEMLHAGWSFRYRDTDESGRVIHLLEIVRE